MRITGLETLGTFENSGYQSGAVVFPVKLTTYFVDALLSHFPLEYKSKLMA
jgi:hypothetical protein